MSVYIFKRQAFYLTVKKIILLCLVSGICFTNATLVFAEDEEQEKSLEQSQTGPQAGPMQRIPGLGRHSPQLKKLCEFIAKDGRRELIHEVALKNSVKHDDCPACRDFYRILSRSCAVDERSLKKPIVKRSRKSESDSDAEVQEEQEDSETAEPESSPEAVFFKQRYPHVNVIQTAILLGEAWAADPYVAGYFQVAGHFTERLMQTSANYAAFDYCDILVAAMMAPFLEFSQKSAPRQGASETKPDRTEISPEQLDSLFEE